MKRAVFLLIISCFVFSFRIVAQGTPSWPKTLLWRISGNGLSKQSFLYGTMHLQDKRLFYFSDSLYHYLEQAEGYALEIDLNEFMDSIMQKMVDEKMDEYYDEEAENKKMSVKEKKKIVDSLVRNVKEFKDKSSKKRLERMREKKIRNALQNKEMPTIMDAYLYSIARRQGKWLGGIEDVQDQLSVFDELGAEISSEELLASDKEVLSSLEQMISVYLARDLDKIAEYATGRFSDRVEDILFLKRNVKMAMRMDSLAHKRSMFYAVGAAHLPGDSGVINLLKRKGYQVDPVFSAQTIDPIQYTAKLKEVPWVKVEDEKKTYQIEMPGKASDLNMFSDLIKMKFYADMGTLTYFMSGSTIVPKDVDFNKLMDNFSKNVKGKVLSKKIIEINGLKGVESSVLTGGYYYKVQYLIRDNTMFMLMAGGEKKEQLETSDVKKFFSSFVAARTVQSAVPKEWKSFGIEEKAFKIMLPGVPKRNKTLEKQADGSEWNFTVYDFIHEGSGTYYMIQVRDLQPGYYLTGDSLYFSLFRSNMKGLVDTVMVDELTTRYSFPALRLDGESVENGAIYKSLSINRGNRAYTLFTGGGKDSTAVDLMDKFLESIELTDYKKTVGKKQSVPEANFYSTASFAFVEKKEEAKEGEVETVKAAETDLHYISFNPERVISLEVYKTPLSPYYWISNDSAYFELAGRQYKGWQDSVLSKKPVKNGNLKGMEWVISMPDNNNLKKIRQLLNGDTLYTLISFIASQYINDEEQEQFFREFRVIKEDLHPSIFKTKAGKLLKDLQSTDSSTFANASGMLSGISFSKEDLPVLQASLLQAYPDDSASYYYTTRARLVRAFEDLADSSTVDFIRNEYPKLTGDKEFKKWYLLDVLADYKNQYAYNTLKELVLKYPPLATQEKELSYSVMDSLKLTRSLFPEILVLSRNTLFAERIIRMSSRLLDSQMISLEMLSPYKDNFLYTADTIFSRLEKGREEDIYSGYQYFNLVNLLRHFNEDKTNKMLQRCLRLDQLMLKQEAVLALLKNKQPVAATEIEKLAADRSYRRDLYDSLAANGWQKLFPVKYLTQKLMAESDMFVGAYGEDDEEPEEVILLGEKIALYKGEKQRFYLYKIVFKYENEEGGEEVNEYLGVAGPYSTDIKKMASNKNATGIVWDEAYDKKKTQKQFEKYLADMSAPAED